MASKQAMRSLKSSCSSRLSGGCWVDIRVRKLLARERCHHAATVPLEKTDANHSLGPLVPRASLRTLHRQQGGGGLEESET